MGLTVLPLRTSGPRTEMGKQAAQREQLTNVSRNHPYRNLFTATFS